MSAWFEVFLIFLRLGCTSFGGPIAHLGYFRQEFVERQRWLSEEAYAGLVALCQALPGPASSQVGMAIGLQRAGIGGALAAWLGFTLPSALLLTAFGLGMARFQVDAGNAWLHGLKLAAVAVVAQAVWLMGRQALGNAVRVGLCLAVLGATLAFPGPGAQLTFMVASGLVGFYLLEAGPAKGASIKDSVSFYVAWNSVLLLVALFFALPLFSTVAGAYYSAGALVFGGGHVVLPLLQAKVVGAGWVSNAQFLAGYGAAQAIPGPLFSFAAYLGAIGSQTPSGLAGAALALGAIFLPSFLMVLGVLPFWFKLKENEGFRKALQGLNVGVVGILAAALCTPVATSALYTWRDGVLAAAGLLALVTGKAPAWLVVALTVLVAGLAPR